MPQLRRGLCALLLCLLCGVSGAAMRRERTPTNWRPTHYDVALVFDQQLTTLTRAETHITVVVLRAPLRLLDLDFGTLPVDAVLVNGRRARFIQRAGRLDVTLPRPAHARERLRVSVVYHGRPADGLVLTNDRDGRPSVTGDNWPTRVHNWLPTLDHPAAKATVNFTVTAPARDTVVANGALVETHNNPDATQTWSYQEREPIPPYCMIVAVGEYAVTEAPLYQLAAPAVPLLYYVPQSQAALVPQGFAAAPQAYNLFMRLVAPFPYEKLAHIIGATRFGGMENSSAIVYATTLLDPRPDEPVSPQFGVRRGLVETVAHETAHQWFGDAVTPATWADLWLSEGFATYYAGLFVEQTEGAPAFRAYMRRAAAKVFAYEQTRRAAIYDRDTEHLNDLLNPNSYQKGAWVLHMLRARLGAEKFNEALRHYYAEHRHANATTEDLRAALEEEAGGSLRAFFARWVYGTGHPRYELSWTWQPRGATGGRVRVTLTETQTGPPFLLPLPLEFATTDDGPATRVMLTPTARVTVASFPAARRPADVRLDPDETILHEARVTAAP